jgi:short-subunit dehydrogenase
VGKLQGKVAIVTGASQGSGYCAAIAMARKVAAIVLVSRTRAKLEAVVPKSLLSTAKAWSALRM